MLCSRIGIVAATVVALISAMAWGDRKPNIVLIVSDDQGYADVGFHGSKEIATPNLDALAASGVICTQGYVTFPVCSPSRAGFLTGRHGARFGYNTNPDTKESAPHQNGLPLSERIMADALKAEGYKTGLIGKWHLGTHPQFHPLNRGFDEFFGFLGGGHRYWEWVPDDGRSYSYACPIIRNRDTVPGIEKRYLTDVFSDEACSFVERHRAEPFFLYLAYNAPHEPCEATPELLARVPKLEGKRKKYAAMILSIDDGIGRLREKVKELQLENDTLFIFISDNGGPENANASVNDPLKGQKSQLWEGGIRVPYVMSWKGKLPAGIQYNKPVSTLDFLPTMLAVAGADTRGMPSMEGVNLLPYLDGRVADVPHQTLYWRHITGAFAIRRGDWKLVREADGSRWLFNIEADISESRNLFDTEPKIARELEDAWNQWNASNAAYVPWLPATKPTTRPASTSAPAAK